MTKILVSAVNIFACQINMIHCRKNKKNIRYMLYNILKIRIEMKNYNKEKV